LKVIVNQLLAFFVVANVLLVKFKCNGLFIVG